MVLYKKINEMHEIVLSAHVPKGAKLFWVTVNRGNAEVASGLFNRFNGSVEFVYFQ